MKNEQGFSILELLCVTSIILMLAAVLMVGTLYGRKQALVRSTQNTVRLLSQAAHSYASDHLQEPPPSWITAGGWPATRWPPQPIYNPKKCGIQALCSYLFGSIDNDLDGKINEDPVDGTDNDGDGKIDEDPSEDTSALIYADAKDFSAQFIVRSGNAVDHIIDSWNKPLCYFAPGAPSRNGDSFDLWSAGPDQRTPAAAWGATDYDYLQHGVVAMVKLSVSTGAPLNNLKTVMHGSSYTRVSWKRVIKVDPETYPGFLQWDRRKKKWIYPMDDYKYSQHEIHEEYPHPKKNPYSYRNISYKYPVEPDSMDMDKDGIWARTKVTSTRWKNDWITPTYLRDGDVYVAEMITAGPEVLAENLGVAKEPPTFGGSYRTRWRYYSKKYGHDDIGNW